jgi:hypothetical protein
LPPIFSKFRLINPPFSSSFSHPSVVDSSATHQNQHPLDSSTQNQQSHFEEQPPNGNMKSKDFGNGEGELDMLFGIRLCNLFQKLFPKFIGFFVMNGACIGQSHFIHLFPLIFPLKMPTND